ncbi:PH domain-containing protein [Gordonia sp. zg691]|uniref:PH domain-containing protein n=1 Tax=Gordonia jinghuaiqii TaxID=2758710 RepID=A0A7D7QK20_9ACTN|nr:PH domain-containing protein [Gordonia jinghuaiqii]MBD0861498.1 PH domain-containing protein [Gordonia jinghuaiqii]MCR5976412.1 PH domain-containing protein [Gordonia jinghuaiqii]QMT03624.1 PH domain-containing protein [Gordonia jinghuaiqii]
MSSAAKPSRDEWDLVHRPRNLPRWAIAAAVVVLAIHIVFGLLLTIDDVGVRNLGGSDQVAIILIGVLVSGAILLLTRPRLRVGAQGVEVRNLATTRLFEWDRVLGLTYPEKGFGAWLLFPADEHITVLAIQAGDGQRAIDAMSRFREIEERYRGTVRPGH